MVDFISRARILHNNRYDYSLTEYTVARDKVKIICKIHGMFEQRAYTHLKGCGCPECGKISSKLGGFRQRIFINESFFNEIKEQQIWMIGLFAADGSVNKQGRISISQSGDVGFSIIRYLCDILEIDPKHIIPCKTKRKISYSISFNSEKFLKILKSYNVVNNKTYVYDFPKNLNLEYLRCFLRGYIEGDGCITISSNKQGYKYLSTSFVGTKKFILKCLELISIKGKLSEKGNNLFEIRWYGKKAISFCQWLYVDKNLYTGYKYYNYLRYKETHVYQEDIYKKIKEEVKKMLLKGVTINSISKEIRIPFQTIYRWKSRWRII